MGYRLLGKCYTDWDSTIEAFQSTFPRVDQGNTYSLISAVPVPANKSVSYQILSGTGVLTNGSIYLTECAETMDSFSVQSWEFIFALFFAAMLGFSTGFKS